MQAIDDQAAIEFGSVVWDDQTYISCPLYFLVLEFPTGIFLQKGNDVQDFVGKIREICYLQRD